MSVWSGAAVPRLKPGVRLQNQPARGWVVQAPERVLLPDEIALAVLQRCDGRRTVTEIAAELARAYNAPEETVAADILELLRDLADKGILEDADAAR